jgi:hypothetical protein
MSRRTHGNEPGREDKDVLADRFWSSRPRFFHLVLFYAAYVLAGGFGQGLALIPGVTIIFWPPAGIFVAALLLTPRDSWPWWIAAGCLAELTCNAIWFHSAIPFALIYFGANALVAVTAAWLIGRVVGKPFRLETLEEVAAFVALGAGVAPMISATVIATTDALLGKHSFWTAWPLVWLGDATGLLVSTPLTLVAVRAWQDRAKIPLPRLVEAAALFAILIVIGVSAFQGYLPTPYMLLPPLLWAAARFQLKGAAAALALIAVMEALFAVTGEGALAGQAELVKEKIVGLQTFLGIAAISSLVVAVLSLQHKQALQSLKEANTELEMRVAERTASLRDSEARLRNAIEIAKLSTYSWDPVTGALQWDARLKAMFGLPADAQVDYDIWKNAIHPDDREGALASVAHALDPAGDGIFEAEYRVTGATDGIERWVTARGQTFFAEGKPTGFVGTARDITERKLAEEALRDSERRFRAIFNHQFQFSGLLTPDGKVVDISKSALVNAGGSLEQIVGRDFLDLPFFSRLPETQALWRRQFAEALEHGRSARLEAPYNSSDGSLRYAINTVTTLRDDAGAAKFLLVEGIDITERRQAEQALRDSERHLAAVLEALPIGVALVDREGQILVGNEFYRTYVPAAIPSRDEARFGLWKAYDSGGNRIERQNYPGARALRGERAWPGQEFLFHGDPQRGPVWTRVAALPLRGAQGEVIGATTVIVDIDEEKRAKDALRRSEAEFRTISNAAPALVWTCAATGENIYLNDRWHEYTGQRPEQVSGFGWAATMHPDDAERILPYWQRCCETGETYEGEVRYRRYDGIYRWHAFRALPQRGAHGQIEKWFGVSIDIHETKEAQEALRESERRLELASEAGKLGVHEFNVATGRSTWSASLWHLFGLEGDGEVPLERAVETIHPDDRERIRSEMEGIMRRPGPYQMEFRVRRADGTMLWVTDRGEAVGPVSQATGCVAFVRGTILDISERKRHEEHQRMLMNELNHRVKNTLATIQSMASQTLRTSPDLAEARERFGARLMALSKAHDVLTREKWEGAPLSDIVERAVAPYRGGESERFAIAGPAIRVSPRFALAIAMALHELCTNALKYGALSNDKGKVSVTWTVAKGKTAPELKMRWSEKGGPRVAPPARKGFGTRLIERGLADDLGGEVKMTFARTGVTCAIKARL